MSTITIGLTPPDLTGSVSPRASVSADPDAFAAQLQSATESGASPAVPNPGANVDEAATGSTATNPGSATDALTSLVPPSVGIAQPDAEASAPVVAAAPLPTPVPVVRPDADSPQSAVTGTNQGTALPSDPIGSEAVATIVARPDDPAAPLTQATAGGRRAPRHAVDGDSLPVPVSAVPPVGIPLPVPAAPATDGISAQTPAQASITLEAAAAASPMPPSAATEPPPATTDDSKDPKESKGAKSSMAATGVVPAALPTTLSSLENAAPVAATSAVGNIGRPSARVVASTTSDPVAFAAALAEPAVSSARTVDAPAAPQAPAQPQPLNAQLAPPILALRTAGAGTHVLTLTVSPESVGPVTVRAHVTHGVMRVELSAPTDQGTDALKSMLPDLKRDLSQGGVNSALTIASPNSDGGSSAGQNTFGGAGGSFARDDRPSQFRAAPTISVGQGAGSPGPISVVATTALDVLA
jgi:flagellar hook-length control protein FliK